MQRRNFSRARARCDRAPASRDPSPTHREPAPMTPLRRTASFAHHHRCDLAEHRRSRRRAPASSSRAPARSRPAPTPIDANTDESGLARGCAERAHRRVSQRVGPRAPCTDEQRKGTGDICRVTDRTASSTVSRARATGRIAPAIGASVGITHRPCDGTGTRADRRRDRTRHRPSAHCHRPGVIAHRRVARPPRTVHDLGSPRKSVLKRDTDLAAPPAVVAVRSRFALLCADARALCRIVGAGKWTLSRLCAMVPRAGRHRTQARAGGRDSRATLYGTVGLGGAVGVAVPEPTVRWAAACRLPFRDAAACASARGPPPPPRRARAGCLRVSVTPSPDLVSSPSTGHLERPPLTPFPRIHSAR